MKIPETLHWLSLEDLLNFTGEAIIAIDHQQMVLLVNKNAEILFGCPAEEVLGQSWISLLSVESQGAVCAQIQILDSDLEDCNTLNSKTLELICVPKSGAELPVEVKIVKFSRESNAVYLISLRDISTRKRIEQERLKWAQAFEHAEWGVAVGLADATTLETFNPSFAQMYGYGVEELIGKPIQEVYAPEERGKLREWLSEAHEKGHISFEAIHQRKDGTTFPALVDVTAVKDAQGKVLYRVVNVQDITERKRTEQDLMESEARAGSIIASLDEGIVMQSREGVVLMCNSSAERILGLSVDQMMGRASIDPRWNAIHLDGTFFSSEDRPAMITLRTGQPCTNIMMGINKPEGDRTWVSVNTQPLFHHPQDRLPYAVVATFTDITERLLTFREMERRVQERTSELTALLAVSRDVASTLELKPLLALILQRLRNVVNYTDAGIAVLEDGNFNILEFQGQVSREKMLHFQIPVSQDSGYRRIMQTRKPVIIGDIWQDDPWLHSLKSIAGSEIMDMFIHIHSWIGVPLIARDRVIGILRLDEETPNYYTDDRVRLILAFADHAAVAIENAQFYEHSQSLIVLKERQKLARELHDSVSQALYGIALGIRTSQTLLGRDPALAMEPLAYCLSLADAGMAEMRALIFELRPESLELEGIVMALSKQTGALRARYSIQVLETYCEEPQVSLLIKETIFRIAQEALQNIIKHARADRVELHLDRSSDGLRLEVHDNGQGFVTREVYPGHLGVKSMRERAEQICGSFQIESSPGNGTRIQVWIPTPS